MSIREMKALGILEKLTEQQGEDQRAPIFDLWQYSMQGKESDG
jgi:hypothetical protein